MSKQSSKRRAMEMVNSQSLRRLSTASAPKMAQKCCPIVIVCNFKNVLCSNGCFYKQFSILFFLTHIYTFHLMSLIWLKSEKHFFVVLMINVPQSNVNYVTNLTISQITNHAC